MSTRMPKTPVGEARRFAFVGGFTTAERKARGDGIRSYAIDHATRSWTEVHHLPGLVNPSFLVAAPSEHTLYAVHGDLDYASAFRIDRETGKLDLLGRARTGGQNGVHQALDPTGRFLIVANYGTGSVAVLPLAPDGSLGDCTQVLDLPGPIGPHRTEQAKAHPHHVVFDPSGRFVLVPDKGLDRTFILSFDPGQGRLALTDPGFVASRPGAGPRHIAFHPNGEIAWLLNELDSSVATYRWNAATGDLHPLQILPSLPSDFFGASTAAELAVTPSGGMVYASNRGHDSIVCYAVDAASGCLSATGWVPTQGRDPRFIAIDPHGHTLYAANEQGDDIVSFRIDEDSGRLSPAGRSLAVASPSTIAFVGT
jgi:6-phosphogluconolactonase